MSARRLAALAVGALLGCVVQTAGPTAATQPTSTAASAAGAATAAASTAAATSTARAEGVGLGAVMLVVDVSGSMADPDANGLVKLVGAKKAITALLDGLGPSIPVGLWTYPKDGADCGPGELQVETTTDLTLVGAKARSLTANGGTPTDEALQAAAQQLKADGVTSGATIVLISDGESTCAGDPCEVARGLKAQGIDVTVNTIGFQISDAGADELVCIADATGGEYRPVTDASDLAVELSSLAGSSIDLRVSAPPRLVRSVGLGATQTVTVRADLTNTSPNLAQDVRVRLSPTSERRPFVPNQVRQIGNIESGGSARLEWTFAPPLDFSDVAISFEVEASADNVAPIVVPIDISLQGSVLLSDAGPLLQDRENVVIVGDSYSSGEGTGEYIDGTDTADNPCHRSTKTYGFDLWPERTILACSGAVSDNLWGAQYDSTPPQLEQLDALETPADLVLMSLGGNDAGFTEVIKACVLPGECHEKRMISQTLCNSPFVPYVNPDLGLEIQSTWPLLGPSVCFRDHGSYGDLKIQEAAALADRLVTSYLAIDDVVNSDEWIERRGAPAPILVMTYPSPVPDPTRYDVVLRQCPSLLSFEEWKWVTRFQSSLNGAIATAVAQVRDRGVPIYAVTDVAGAFGPSHTICDDVRYINYVDASDTAIAGAQGLVRGGLNWLPFGLGDHVLPMTTPQERARNEAFHPNIDGYRAMTAALVQWSTTAPALEPVEHDRRSFIEEIQRSIDRIVRLGFGNLGSTVQMERGERVQVEVEGLLPGASASAWLESTPQLLDRVVVGADGVAVLEVPIADDLPTGRHTLTVASLLADGTSAVGSWNVEVDERRTWLAAHSLMIALIAFGICLVAALALWLVDRRRAVALA